MNRETQIQRLQEDIASIDAQLREASRAEGTMFNRRALQTRRSALRAKLIALVAERGEVPQPKQPDELAQAKARIIELERLVAKLRARSGHDDYGGRVCGSFFPGKSCDCGWDEIEKELPVLPPLKEHAVVRLLSDFRFNNGGTARTIPAGYSGAIVSVLPRNKFTVEFLARGPDGFSSHAVVELDRTQIELQ